MKSTNICILMLTTIFTINAYSQQARLVHRKYKVVKDSVIVNHTAVFCKHKYYDQENEEDAVRFTLKVTNLTNHAIPDIQTARFKQTGGLAIFINGNSALQMTLGNGMFGEDKQLLKGESDKWPMDFQIVGPHAIDWGDVFTFQWIYMGIGSPIIRVDVKNRTLTVVSEHLKDGKVVY